MGRVAVWQDDKTRDLNVQDLQEKYRLINQRVFNGSFPIIDIAL